MKYLVLLSLLLIAWMVSISSQVSLIGRRPNLLMTTIFDIFPQNPGNNSTQDEEEYPSGITEDVCNSIFTGMSYTEVSNIIGWEGVLLYENDVDGAEGKIREKIYQWNSQDVNNSSYRSSTSDDGSLYWNITLRFQNGILVTKSCSSNFRR